MSIILDYETDNGRRGLGDIIISTAIIKALFEEYHTRIDVVLRKEAQPLLKNNPYVRRIYEKYPGDCDLWLIMGWKLEKHDNPRNNQPRVDSMAAIFGVNPIDKKPQLYYQEVEKIPNSIGIAIESTNTVREWTVSNAIALMEKIDKEWHVFGQRNKIGSCQNWLNLDLPSLIQQVHRMERFVTVDSLFSHLTAAFDIPTIVMYTEVPKEWRRLYYPKTIGLQAQVDCSPCWERQHPELKGKIDECYNRQNSGQSIKCVESFTPEIIEKAINDYFL